MSTQPVITNNNRTRRFACSAVALSIFIMNEEEKILLLSSPPKRGRDGWETVSGALEAEETVLEGALRETREEIGPDVRVRPLGTIHAYTFHYDDNIRYMIGLCYLMAYEGGRIIPGDDMSGSRYRWYSLEELENENTKILQAPTDRKWLLNRTLELYRLWQSRETDLEQLGLHTMG